MVLSSPNFDVLQEGTTVIAVDLSAHQLRVVDPATVALSRPVKLPDDAAVGLGGGMVAIADRAAGKVWTVSAERLDAAAGTDIISAIPQLSTGPGTVLAVAQDGLVAATAPGAQSIVTLAPAVDGTSAAADPNAAPGGPAGVQTIALDRPLSLASATDPRPVSLAMVGDTAVVLDAVAHRILARDKDFPLPDGSTSVTIQDSGPAADSVLVATTSHLLRMSLDDGAVQEFDSGTTGSPAAPVWLGGCAHAAWAGSAPTYLSWCGSVPKIRPLPNSDASHPLVFRVNGSEIVLNDSVNGAVWTLEGTLAVISDWSQVSPVNTSDTNKDPDAGNEQQSDQDTLSRTDCSKGITPPSAVADTAGIRAGHPTIVRVMSNDATTDCSVVVIDKVSGWAASVGSVQIADAGRALQVATAPGVTGPLPPLSYEITDGAGHDSSATVAISVVPAEQHPPPHRIRDSAAMLGPNGTISTDVLEDWESPAGDPLWLTAVEADGQDLAVGFQAAGSVTVHDTGVAGPGKRTVTFALTDGTTIEHGVLIVDVVGAGDATPTASPVYATGVAGRPVIVDPMAAVSSPGAAAARLASVTPPAARGGLTITPDLDAGTVAITASAPGSYQIGYGVVAGEASASGVIRVVITPDDAAGQPVPVADTAFLPQSGQVRVDLTANDGDPSGGVLAVQRLIVPATAPLVVTLTDMHIAQISARRSLPAGGVWFSYDVSDGGGTVTGWVHVVAVPVPAGEGPTASAARISVRAGDAATLQLTDIATDRDGNAMTVQAFQPLPGGQGLLFAAGDRIRYLAPATPPAAPISTTYTVTDTAGRSDTAPLTITVVPAGGNHAPRIPPVAVARVFAGASVDIALPLGGTDPDGDWVTVDGIDDPGQLGSVAVSGPDSIAYTALDTPGADAVTYTAVDPFGAEVVGRVDLVVVPVPSVADPPVAPDLQVAVAPGGSIGVDVLGAVSDPAGSTVGFASGTPSVPPGAGVTASIADGLLAVTAGPQPTVVPITYTVVNARGLSASGVVTVTVTPDAPTVPPTAADVWVTASQLSPDRTSVVVDVTPYVTNPGGRVSDLSASLPQGPSGAAVNGRTVTVPLTGARQVLAYQVRNSAGLTADAFIVVPQRTTLVPEQPPVSTRPSVDPSTTIATSVPPPPPFEPRAAKKLTVDAGTTVTVAVADYVTGAAPGRTITVPAGANLSASVGTLTRIDAGTLRWAVPDTAGGPAVLRLRVTDGTSAPSAVTVQATVTPKEVPPPTFDSTTVSVAAGDSTTVSLGALVTPGGPDQQLSFAGPSGEGGGVSGSLAGATLTVKAQADTPKGTTVQLGVSVSDGVHAAVPATVTVRVTGSSAALATVPAVTVPDAVQGAAVTRNVLDGATNPLAPAGPLRLVSPVQVIEGTAAVSFTPTGSVTVTPGPGQVGLVTIEFTVADATGDPDRYVTGTMKVTVRGKPDRISTPGVVDVGDRTAVLKWSTPNANGAPITGYTVASGGYRHTCAASPCTLTGLTNNVTYRFTVVAHNAVGDSDPSARSAAARPDVAPAAPGAPSVTFGDGSITASWRVPVDRGSPITRYRVTISPKPVSGSATVQVTGTTYTFKNLANGTGYTVTVVAQNSSGSDSPASDPSDPLVPAGVPGTPGAPTLTYTRAQAEDSRIDIGWNEVDGNGDDQLTYAVHWSGSDGRSGTINVTAGDPLRGSITGIVTGVTYTATVRASNKAGTSPAGATASLVAFDAPDPVSKPDAVATGENGTVTLAWTPAKANGSPVTQYQYTFDGGGSWTSVGTVLTTPVSGLSNGRTYQFQVRACDGAAFRTCGAASDASDQVIPFGPIDAPQPLVATTTTGSVTFGWADPKDNGLAPYQFRVNGAAGQGANSAIIGALCGTRVSVSVVAVDTKGHTSPAGRASGRTDDCPPPPYVDEEVDTRGLTGNGAPTFPSLADLSGTGVPFLAYQSIQHIACYVNANLIGTDGGRWYQIFDGPAAGRWTPSNNFVKDRDPAVPAC